jgi:hypothetical protein
MFFLVRTLFGGARGERRHMFHGEHSILLQVPPRIQNISQQLSFLKVTET